MIHLISRNQREEVICYFIEFQKRKIWTSDVKRKKWTSDAPQSSKKKKKKGFFFKKNKKHEAQE